MHSASRSTALEQTEIRVFTTRPDTVFGVTFMVLAPEHPLVSLLTTPDKKEEVQTYVEETRRRSEIERMSTGQGEDGSIHRSLLHQPAER